MNKKSIVLLASVVLTGIFGQANLVWAGDATAAAEPILQKKLLQPLKKYEKEQSKFSRAESPPDHYRVQMEPKGVLIDTKGNTFVPFSVEALYSNAKDLSKVEESQWRKDHITGCVYFESSAIFVKRGGKYYNSSLLLGRKASVQPDHVCRAK